jgi:hypothetical protein
MLAVGCGGSGDDASDLAALVPPDAPLYLEGTVRPGPDEAAIDSIASAVGVPGDPGDLIVASLDRALAQDGLSYADDIEPWLGDRVALFFRSFKESKGSDMPDFGAVVETSDSGAAQDFLDEARDDPSVRGQERSYGGVHYLLDQDGIAFGLVDGALVIGTEGSLMAAVDASKGESLASFDGYTQMVGALPDDRLATAYGDPETLIDASIKSGETSSREAAAAKGLFGPLFEGPVAGGLEVRDDSITIDLSLPSEGGLPTNASSLLETLPADAWAAYAFDDAGDTVGGAIAQLEAVGRAAGEPELRPGSISHAFHASTGLDLDRDVLRLIDSAAAFASGTIPADLRLGLDLKTTDPKASARTIEALRKPLDKLPHTTVGPPPGDADAGLSLTNPGGPGALVIELAGDLITASVAAESDQAKGGGAEGGLGHSEGFQAATAALGGEFPPLAFLDFSRLLDVAEGTGSLDSGIDPTTRQVLDALAFAAIGAHPNGNGAVVRIVLGLDNGEQ